MKQQTITKWAVFLSAVCVLLTTYTVWEDAFADDSKGDKHAAWHKGLPKQYHSKWFVHDLNRPKPTKVAPAAKPCDAPADAIVLFDGTDLSKWMKRNGADAEWTVKDGYAELNHTRSIMTRQKFGDCQLHLEFRTPTPPGKKDQHRGNSGIIFMNRYEMQVLDNHDNPTYADGYVGAVYGQHPPLANACRAPGEWQTYDIIFRRPRLELDGKDVKVIEPGRFTAFLNGVLVQHNAEIYGPVRWRDRAKYQGRDVVDEKGKPIVADHLQIQDHGDRQKMRFRNIWIRPLDFDAKD